MGYAYPDSGRSHADPGTHHREGPVAYQGEIQAGRLCSFLQAQYSHCCDDLVPTLCVGMQRGRFASRGMNIMRIGIFGSAARRNMTDQSDIDIVLLWKRTDRICSISSASNRIWRRKCICLLTSSATERI